MKYIYSVVLLVLHCITLAVAFTCAPLALRCHWLSSSSSEASSFSSASTKLYQSSFYGKFEEDDFEEDDEDDDDDDDDDDYDDLEDLDVDNFRSRMDSMFAEDDITAEKDTSEVDELISFATAGASSDEPADWANVANVLTPGTILLANPTRFCADLGPGLPPPDRKLLAKYGLTLPPPADLGPDRRADLLPVLLVVDVNRENGCQAVLLNRRTGHLLGDLEPPSGDESNGMPILEKFCIQPLWFGGIDNVSAGLDMLHQCPVVEGAMRITDDGLYWGGKYFQYHNMNIMVSESLLFNQGLFPFSFFR